MGTISPTVEINLTSVYCGLYWKNMLGKFLKSPKGVQRDMLRDESSCDGGSIVEKLESFVQGMYTVYCAW